MAHAMGMRATSLAASTALLALAAIAGLTMTIVQPHLEIPEGRSFTTYIAPPPVRDPPRAPEEAPPPRPIENESLVPFEPPLDYPAGAETASYAGTSSAPPMIVDPTWVRRPRDLARYYPARALQREVEGRVVLNCAVSTIGALSCSVVSETPAGWGFAHAALRISRDYRMVPAMRDGAPVEGRHRMVIPFELR